MKQLISNFILKKEVINIRDPKRIEEVLYYLNKIWQSQPDTRFNQLINNLQYEFNSSHNNKYYHEVWEHQDKYFMIKSGYLDLFHVEDDVFLEWLKNKIK